MPRRHRVESYAAAALAVVLLAPKAPVSAAADVRATWAAAVIHHVPGQVDDALRTIWTLTYAERNQLLKDLYYLSMQVVSTLPDGALTEEAEVAGLVKLLGRREVPAWFIARAAVLHADAAMFDSRPPESLPSLDNQVRDPEARRFWATNQRTFAVVRDGEVVGRENENWNWPAARNLLDTLKHEPALAPFVALWYHATAAYMFHGRAFGELANHLESAAYAAPGDALILYDRGCLADALTLVAARLSDSDDPAAKVYTNYLDAGFASGALKGTASPPVIVIDRSHSAAAELFTRAIAADGSLTEARVRLARLSEESRQFAEADADLTAALATGLDPDVAYYAHLFAARATMALDRAVDAQAHAQAALALYPTAESALVAASQIALLRGDTQAALQRLDGLADTPAGPPSGADPWTVYVIGPGRIADDLLFKLWKAVPPRPGTSKH